MNMSLGRVKRLLPDSEFKIVAQVVDARSLPEQEITRLRGLVRGWRDKYVDRAHQQAREARRKAKPRSTRGADSNENTMRQADIMDWVLDRLTELEEAGAAQKGAPAGEKPSAPAATDSAPTPDQIREAIAQPHVSTFGDLWAEFPDAPVPSLRKALWTLVEAGEVDLTTAGGIELSAEEEVAFVEEVQAIEGVPAARRTREKGLGKRQQDHFARTKVVRIHSHKRSSGARKQAKRDSRGGKRG
ncbi:MAG: hypothetical protein EA421_14935 [Gemmatimonadales bacterium]|nr:MAG: hypothetical protein EA421_14935 [Gemmatimonadales bacterium]